MVSEAKPMNIHVIRETKRLNLTAGLKLDKEGENGGG